MLADSERVDHRAQRISSSAKMTAPATMAMCGSLRSERRRLSFGKLILTRIRQKRNPLHCRCEQPRRRRVTPSANAPYELVYGLTYFLTVWGATSAA